MKLFNTKMYLASLGLTFLVGGMSSSEAGLFFDDACHKECKATLDAQKKIMEENKKTGVAIAKTVTGVISMVPEVGQLSAAAKSLIDPLAGAGGAVKMGFSELSCLRKVCPGRKTPDDLKQKWG